LVVGRVEYRPFGRFDDDQEGDLDGAPRWRVALGLAAAYNVATSRTQSTVGQAFKGARPDYVHGAADVVIKYAGWSFLGEVLGRKGQDGPMATAAEGRSLTEFTRSAYGYLVQSGFVVVPRLEGVARYAQLFPWGDTDPAFRTDLARRGQEVSTGLNFYAQGHFLKLQGDYTYQWGSSASASTASVPAVVAPARDALGQHTVRLQVDGSF
jgi:hypothetical protein